MADHNLQNLREVLERMEIELFRYELLGRKDPRSADRLIVEMHPRVVRALQLLQYLESSRIT